jgi:hypothetical protein
MVLFANDEVIHRCSKARPILYNVRCKMHLFVAKEVHKGYFDVTHFVHDKGAIRGVALLITGMLLEAPFL